MPIRFRPAISALILASALVPLITLATPLPVGADPSELPTRVLDTRPNGLTIDGDSAGTGRVAAGATAVVSVAGRANLPANPASVALNVVAVQPAAAGHITTYACDDDRPTASQLNFRAGRTVAASTISDVSAQGTVCVYSSAGTDLVIDVIAVFGETAFTGVAPARLLETRRSESTIDGTSNGIGRANAGSTTTVQIAGRGNVPSSANAVAANLTIVRPSGPGHATVYPCDQGRPHASNINFDTGQTVANLVITELDARGRACIFTTTTTDIVLDTTAYGGAATVAYAPARLLETRRSGSTIDGTSNGIGRANAGSTTTVQIAGRGNVPSSANAVAANLTIVRPSGPGHATVYPCDQGRPHASNINFDTGQTVANLVITELDARGRACIFTTTTTDIVLDTTATVAASGTIPTNDYVPPGRASSLPVDESAIPSPASGASTSLIGPASYSPVTPSDGVAAFRVSCRFSHMAFDDPIVVPGQAGGSHLHTFAGNTGIDAFSTADSVANSGTSTCSGGTANRSGYWAPTVVDTATSRPIAPTGDHAVQVYYKAGYQGVPASEIVAVPEGLRIVAGDVARRAPDNSPAPHVSYHCVSEPSGSSSPSQQTFPSCSPGQTFVMTVVFPQCWNGRDLDSADHKSHMAYGTWGPTPGRNGAGCPSTHPVALPEITQNYRYRVPAGGMGSWRLVTDVYNGPPGYSGHADWYNGWHAPTFERMLDNCFGQRLDCRMNLLGDGQALLVS